MSFCDFSCAWGSGRRFEKVRSGGRQMENPMGRAPQLELGNMYGPLSGGAD